MTATDAADRDRLRRHFLLALGGGATSLLLAACGSAPPRARSTAHAPRPVFYPTLTQEQSSDIAIHALGLVGTPYRYGGNTPEGGFDCSGLIGYVYRTRAGLVPPRTVSQLSDFGQPVGVDELRTGDLVLFGAGRPTHAGIYVGEGRFVHAPSTGGEVRLDRLAGPYWSRQTLAVRRP
ncbi:C40 family peptidase [Variovorax ginsengisoli]|uniref:Cell wall-associated NlpC family hydrolase n=1 Tax=Variovorax ginsengisoli TaxID=363844 RepID=A0ABT9S0X4_9BURK|nr:C40 family peptidase [Variovorax ginsengisoli]MDP9897996.1 cell wall-associated NlpC family hydrolase [Variovorax ginsengisoli]